MSRVVHVRVPTALHLRAKGSPATYDYVAHDHEVADDGVAVGDIVLVEGRQSEVIEVTAGTVVVRSV